MLITCLIILLCLVTGTYLVNRRDWQNDISKWRALVEGVNGRYLTELAEKQDALREVTALNTMIDQIRVALDDANAYIAEEDKETSVRNEILDYVLTTFQLHLPNPYVYRPTFEEKRCIHCMYPDFAGHDANCIWAKLRPYTSVLYPPPQLTRNDEVTEDDNTMLPAGPTAPESDTEVPEAIQGVSK